MKALKRNYVSGIISIILGLLIAIGPKLIFPVCSALLELTSGKKIPMKCFWTSNAEIAVGALIVITGIILIVFMEHAAQIVTSIFLFLHGLTALLFPTFIIGVCPTETMSCHIATLPALIVLSSCVMLLAVINLIVKAVSAKKME